MGYKINSTIRELLFVMNNTGTGVTGLTNVDFVKALYKNGVSTAEVVTVTEEGDGYYWVTFIPLALGQYAWIVTQATYQPEGWFDYHLVNTNDVDDVKDDTEDIIIDTTAIIVDTTAIQADLTTIGGNVDTINTNVDTINSNVSTLLTYTLRVLGLSQENTYMDTTTFDSNNNMTSMRLRIYSVAGSVGTASDVLATYTITSTFNVDSELQTYKMVKS